MAGYTANLRDHVWVIVSDGTAGGFSSPATPDLGGGSSGERWRTIRWIPNAATDTITIDRIKIDGTTETIFESQAGGATSVQESRLDVRFTRGFKIVMTNLSRVYAYQALD